MTKLFRWIGFAEGVSFLILLGIAMPLKYWLGYPLATRIVGMAHGILFILYVGLATLISIEKKWPTRVLMWAYAASVLPFGTFVFQRRFNEHHV